MWGGRYWAKSYWAGSYWPPSDAPAVTETVDAFSGEMLRRLKKRRNRKVEEAKLKAALERIEEAEEQDIEVAIEVKEDLAKYFPKLSSFEIDDIRAEITARLGRIQEIERQIAHEKLLQQEDEEFLALYMAYLEDTVKPAIEQVILAVKGTLH